MMTAKSRRSARSEEGSLRDEIPQARGLGDEIPQRSLCAKRFRKSSQGAKRALTVEVPPAQLIRQARGNPASPPPKRHQALYNMKKQGAQPFELRALLALFASVLPNDSALNENRSMQPQPSGNASRPDLLFPDRYAIWGTLRDFSPGSPHSRDTSVVPDLPPRFAPIDRFFANRLTYRTDTTAPPCAGAPCRPHGCRTQGTCR